MDTNYGNLADFSGFGLVSDLGAMPKKKAPTKLIVVPSSASLLLAFNLSPLTKFVQVTAKT
jgi:hypothetical protein